MLHKVIIVAIREFQAAVRTKTFLMSVVMMPILMSGGIVAQKFMERYRDVGDKHFAVIDRTGAIYDKLVTAAEQRNETMIYEMPDEEAADDATDGASESAEPRQVESKFVLERVEWQGKDPDALRVALSDRIREQKLFGFVEIDENVFDTDLTNPNYEPASYHSNNPVFGDFRRWVAATISEAVRTHRMRDRGIAEGDVAWALQDVRIDDDLGLVSEIDGKAEQAGKERGEARIFVGVIMCMLMFVVIAIGATPLISVVLEEKINRIAEVLLGSITPFDLMLGKLIGTVGVALTVLAVYLTGGVFAAQRLGYGDFVPQADLFVWFVVFQAMAVLFFGSMFVAVGAACNDMKEAQSALLPVWLLVCIPLFVIGPVVENPTSQFAVGLSLFPPATPMLMPMRMAMYPDLPLWQPVAGIILSILATLVCVYAAGRIFRVGILMHGRSAKMSEMLRWVFKA